MLNVTTKAKIKLTEYVKTNNISPFFRVAMMQGGCSGPSLGLALDEEKPNDESFQQESMTFLVEKSLLQQVGSIAIDYIDVGSQSGFSIVTENPIASAEGSCCSGSCGSNGCGC